MFSARLIPVTQPTAWRSSGTMPTPAAVISFGDCCVRSRVRRERIVLRSAGIIPASTAVEFALAIAFDAGNADDLAAIDRQA